MASPRQRPNSLHLAHPTRNYSDSASTQPSGGSRNNNTTSNQRLDRNSNCTQPKPNDKHNNTNDPPILVSLDPPAQQNSNQTNSSSSSDDEDGGDQDEESDSTESISTDESDYNNQSPVRRRTPSQQGSNAHKEVDEEKEVQEDEEDVQEQEVLIHDWPVGRPLPYPQWDQRPPKVVHFENVLEYEAFAGLVELVSQRVVSGHKYNTVDNFIRFYRAFKKSKMDSLESFYRQYQSPITPCHYTCVGLAHELISQINATLPTRHPAAGKFYVTSCEEAIETTEEYIKNTPPDKEIVEKEHVSVCLKIMIGHNRNGCMLLDPGYHVSRPVTIMEDGIYPHTGKFVQNDDGTNKKEYEYTHLAKLKYINWTITDTKKGKVTSHSSLIFIDRPFLSGLDCAERRNLVYDFKSVLKRDPKGQPISGLYFPLTKTNVKKTMTIFFMENNNRVNVRLNVSRNVKETREIQLCEEQMGLKRGKLTQTMNVIGRVLHDENFLNQILHMNAEIVRISAEN
ncbi:uncharacterized protein LOC110847209 [Folsomia candida]|uniref:uncharacterized protein LOC110847209 n=1 Tax=Folsomia candida TaxID=158441 RepID=UPI0016054A0F|nr:uncharacterized protein LOC110847209 [Folsomia candida]